MDPLNIHPHLYDVHHEMKDPGDGGIIRPTGDLQICEMVSVAAETRTLANPTKPGIRFVLRMLTDGGDIVVSVPNGLNSDLESKATFNDVSDLLNLVSVTTSTGVFRWEIMKRHIVFQA